MIPRELAQARKLELLEIALTMTPDQRGVSAPGAISVMSRDQLIAFILNERERRDRHFRKIAIELMNRDQALARRFAAT